MIDLPIIDTDTHLSEPPDLWTSRLASKWGDDVPRTAFDERRGEDVWVVGGRRISGVAGYAMAGWHEYPPKHPPTMEQAHPAAFENAARVKRMDEEGIVAEVIYPNLISFSADAFLKLEPQLTLDCVRAYNDFLVDFASIAPDRFILLTTLPFWDIDESVAELERCHDRGHRGINLLAKPYKFGWPPLSDKHWEPLLKSAEERGMSVNFHTGFQSQTEEDWRKLVKQGATDYAKEVSLSMIGLSENMAELLFSGICEQYPNLNFVNVESGFGWIPYFLESADWFWRNSGSHKTFPSRELPSFYYRRQIFTTYWFERETVRRMADLYPDNLMFETDFPHPTSLSLGPASDARTPRQVVNDTLDELPESLCRKIFYETAAKLYRVEVPITTS